MAARTHFGIYLITLFEIIYFYSGANGSEIQLNTQDEAGKSCTSTLSMCHLEPDSLKFFGSKGDKGEMGKIGPKGEKGTDGLQGTPGARGLQGPQGEKGNKGDRGEMGQKGDRGQVGFLGPSGEKGEKGNMGEKGAVGEPGPKGEMGLSGLPGTNGLPGVKGIPGDKGDKGEMGQMGPIGPQGEIGFVGFPGQKGDKGDQGKMGPSGQKGEMGGRGAQGEIGPMGPKGDMGRAGSSGLNGLPGTEGKRGDKGDKGDKGESGPKGEIGPVGLPGMNGLQGLSGKKGEIGMKGDKGAMGRTGLPGTCICASSSSDYDDGMESDDIGTEVNPDSHLCNHSGKINNETIYVGQLKQPIKVNCYKGLTCVITEKLLSTGTVNYQTKTEPFWLSEFNGFRMNDIYDLSRRQLLWLQEKSTFVKQILRYHCKNSQPYNAKNVDKSLQLLTFNDFTIGPVPSISTSFSYSVAFDGCSEAKMDEWTHTDIVIETDVVQRLPIVDFLVRDVRSANQEFKLENIELCFG